jgi:hypothetical protein
MMPRRTTTDNVSDGNAGGDGKPQPFPNTSFVEWGPAFSQVSTDGGEEPLWSRDGRELFYRYGQKGMVSDRTLSQAFGDFAV